MLCEKALWPESGFQVLGFAGLLALRKLPTFCVFQAECYGPNLGFKCEDFPGLLALRKGSMARIWVSSLRFSQVSGFQVFAGLLALRQGSMARIWVSRFSQVCLLGEKALSPESGCQL